MLFIGLDLAWSVRNRSGLAVFEGDEFSLRLVSVGLVRSDDDVIEAINDAAHNKPVLVAIDAPLVVPNRKGRRKAEELVGLLFGQYDAGAHPANRERLSAWDGGVRGERIVERLKEIGVVHDPCLKPLERSRKCFEVYPHPSMVVLFDLARTLKYKAKPKRSYDERWSAFAEYQERLRSLPDVHVPESLVGVDPSSLKGQSLKDHEDRLDAVFCAYIAYFAWKFPDRCDVLGSLREGYILTPVFPRREKRLAEYLKKE